MSRRPTNQPRETKSFTRRPGRIGWKRRGCSSVAKRLRAGHRFSSVPRGQNAQRAEQPCLGSGFLLRSAGDWRESALVNGIAPGEYKWSIGFPATHWSVVLEAKGQSAAAQQALEKLCRTYWRPVYSFIRRQGVAPEEAEDLTQSFFALLLERRDFDAVRKDKGRLRSYLLTSLKHFLASEHRRAMTAKRGKGQRPVPLEELTAAEQLGMEPADPLTATGFMNVAGP